ncbi:unnamed protein product [Rhizophagus irregularis]|nr:unnamed protein product [Rhizophagus irregularis]
MVVPETSVVVKPSIKNKYYVKFNIAETILSVYLNVPVSAQKIQTSLLGANGWLNISFLNPQINEEINDVL